ncbi:MAG: RluA family pseudouridine synthase [Kiritimatiellae bacterium]|nr:RluA family pseudouridine synthase [Kiritimatiellia bacterium]
MQEFTAELSDRGERVDRWLTRQLPDVSRSRIQALIHSGAIVSEAVPLSPGTRVTDGMVVCVEIPAPVAVTLEPEAIPLNVLYEDSHLIAVNKPAGLVVHPAPGHPDGTLVNALLYHCNDLAGVGGELRPGIVHRLDRDTSGVLVVAKNEQAMEGLSRQFRMREVEKVYYALVHGTPTRRTGKVESLIGRSRHDRKKMSARPSRGREALTHYAVVASCEVASLLRVQISTGRTHQIRVHMAHIGYPVVGDCQYGRSQLDRKLPVVAGRQMLHAYSLRVSHPCSGESLHFVAPVPEDMCTVRDALDMQPSLHENSPANGDVECP